MSKANDRQVGGQHYKQVEGAGAEQHWDRVEKLGLDYFQACATKYIERCWDKNGIEDLYKARHYLDKYIEIHEAKGTLPFKQRPAFVVVGPRCTNCRHLAELFIDGLPYCHEHADMRAKDKARSDESPSRTGDDAPNYNQEPQLAAVELSSVIATQKCILCGSAAGMPHLADCDRAWKEPLIINTREVFKTEAGELCALEDDAPELSNN